tara:strand:+ start:386 stop:703 length:318 start_codon:yes stop_codon:yes gene_type:complete
VGQTTAKNITAMTIGETKRPNKIPNLNQILFRGDKIGELIKPKNKKAIDKINDQILIFPSLCKGKIDTIKKNTKKTIPKLLFEPIFIFSFCRIKLMKVASSCPLF